MAISEGNAKKPEIGKILDEAMEAIEKENPSLKGVLPKVYAKGNIDPINLGGLIDLFSNIAFDQTRKEALIYWGMCLSIF